MDISHSFENFIAVDNAGKGSFVGSLARIVMGIMLLLLFMAWEIMGLCSYLLISFWFEKEYPVE